MSFLPTLHGGRFGAPALLLDLCLGGPLAHASNEVPTVTPSLARTSLRFTENLGQVADVEGKDRPNVRFTAHGKGAQVFVTSIGVSYQFSKQVQTGKATTTDERPVPNGKFDQPEIERTDLYRLDLVLVGANPNPTIATEGMAADYENYYLAHTGEAGVTGALQYRMRVVKVGVIIATLTQLTRRDAQPPAGTRLRAHNLCREWGLRHCQPHTRRDCLQLPHPRQQRGFHQRLHQHQPPAPQVDVCQCRDERGQYLQNRGADHRGRHQLHGRHLHGGHS